VATTPYTPEFMSGIAAGSRRSASLVLPHVFELCRPASVIDVGCGPGAWLAECASLGVRRVVGVDGDYVDRRGLLFPAERFVAADLPTVTAGELSARLPAGEGRFDLAISVEVAEHLPAAAATGFVGLLCGLSPLVLFSAAIPVQGGTNHVNERFPSYWASLFRERGYLVIDTIRQRVWNDERVEWWYRQNVMLFAAPGLIAATPRLAAARVATREEALDVIHPAHYERVLGWWRSARAAQGGPRQGR
jgi:SAM-dependent methyltransferase